MRLGTRERAGDRTSLSLFLPAACAFSLSPLSPHRHRVHRAVDVVVQHGVPAAPHGDVVQPPVGRDGSVEGVSGQGGRGSVSSSPRERSKKNAWRAAARSQGFAQRACPRDERSERPPRARPLFSRPRRLARLPAHIHSRPGLEEAAERCTQERPFTLSSRSLSSLLSPPLSPSLSSLAPALEDVARIQAALVEDLVREAGQEVGHRGAEGWGIHVESFNNSGVWRAEQDRMGAWERAESSRVCVLSFFVLPVLQVTTCPPAHSPRQCTQPGPSLSLSRF